MIKFLHVALLVSALAMAGCCCPNTPEPLPAGSVPLTNGYGPVVTPQPAPAVAPAPKAPVAKKRTYAKKRTTVRKAPTNKTTVRKRTVRKAVKPAAPRSQAVPPIPVPLDEVQEAGRRPERLQ